MTENQMIEWHYRLSGHELEQALGVGGRQGSLACCSPWGPKELGTTEQLNNNTWKDSISHYIGSRDVWTT